VDGLVKALEEALVGSAEPELEPLLAQLSRFAQMMETAFRSATKGEVPQSRLRELSEGCRGLYDLSPGQLARDAIGAFASGLSSQYCLQGGHRGPDVLRRMDQCLAEVGLVLSKSALAELNETNFELRRGLREEHLISKDLLRGHEMDPAALGWAARTHAHAAVLALWRHEARVAGGARLRRATGRAAANRRPIALAAPPADESESCDNLVDPGSSATGSSGGVTDDSYLEVVGTFEAGNAELVLSQQNYVAEQFPPRTMFDKLGRDSILLVFPVVNDERNWGLLSVVLPAGRDYLKRDNLFEWEGLLPEALGYGDAVRGLRDKTDQLERSFERERQMAQAVKESEQRYALAARASNDGLWDWDLTAGTMHYSSRWKKMFGYALGDIGQGPQEWLERVHPDDRASLTAAIDAMRNGHRSSASLEHRMLSADGSYRWSLCRALAVPGRGEPAKRIVGFLTDITDQRSLEERLRHQALHDQLTGLPNRFLFVDRLAQAIVGFKRKHGGSYAVFWLDIDGFKVLNDSFGHVTGDKLLVQVAERIRNYVRESDTAARFGGDEFALLLQGTTDVVYLGGVARRLLEHLNQPYLVDGHRVVVSASIGIATSLRSYRRPEEVLRDADIAMYKAKAHGPGSFVVFDSVMYEGAITRMETETQFRQAIEVGQLELHYQPVVYIHNRQIVALEALVRWRHPTDGVVLPLKFLTVAEESGLVVPMGRWVQQEACRQIANWQSEGLLDQTARVGVNVSNREFWDPLLVEGIDRAIAESGLRPQSLVIEITEGVIMENLDQALRILQRLHDRGLQLSIDDFGTGRSSLEALYRLPIDSLKVDKSFVSGVATNKRAAVLARTIVQMGCNLGLRVIAEGIESQDEADYLATLGCMLGQGFLFHHPLPAAEVAALLGSQPSTGYGQDPARVLFPARSRQVRGDDDGEGGGRVLGSSTRGLWIPAGDVAQSVRPFGV
jgi:diguanylate cyclase (GGDEF)-like protein/PAS domain S-box-containing protein